MIPIRRKPMIDQSETDLLWGMDGHVEISLNESSLDCDWPRDEWEKRQAFDAMVAPIIKPFYDEDEGDNRWSVESSLVDGPTRVRVWGDVPWSDTKLRNLAQRMIKTVQQQCG